MQSAELVRRYYERLDGRPLDRAHEWVEELAAFFEEDATIRVVNGRPAPWRQAFVHERARLPEIVATTRHEVLTVLDGDDGRVAFELAVTYELRRGGSVTLPGSVFAVVRDGRFAEQHMYVDFAPVFRAGRDG